MKTVLANVSNSFFVRNFLRSDPLKILESNGNVRLVLLVPKKKLEYYRSEFPSSNIIFDVMPEVNLFRVEKLFKFLETASIYTNTSLMLSKHNLYRTGSKDFVVFRYLSFFVRYIIWQVGRTRVWREFLRSVYLSFSNDAYDEILEKYLPDLVFLPSMIYVEDYIVAKAAKKKGVKTLGMTLSWDNFYSKTLLLVKPDILMVHTGLIVEQAKNLGDYDSGKIVVTGIPQYDRYFKKEGLISRDEYFRKIGADPSKKLILYAFSGKAGIDIEFSVLEILHKVINEGKISKEVQVLLRPYPRYDFSDDKLDELRKKYGFLAQQPVSHPVGGSDDWEFNAESLNFLSNSLAHADLVITMYSTFFIEAAIFDRPLIAAGFDGAKNLDYWNSSKRFFDWDHLSELKPLNGIKIVRNQAEFVMAINGYLENPTLLSEGRKQIVLQQSQFTDGESGMRLAKTILGALGLE